MSKLRSIQRRRREVILEELESDARWEGSFARSQDVLARLADEALAEYRADKTEEFPRNRG